MVGDIIKQRMEDKKISIYALSKKSEVAYATLHDIISGKSTNPRVGTLIKIADALNQDVQALVKEDENEKSNFKD